MPRLEPPAPIRLADRNHAHYPSRQRTILKKRRLDDGLLFIYILFELLGGRSSQPSDWLPFREWGKMSELTLEGGASRVRVTSSDDSRVDRIACAGSPSSSRLFFEDGALA